MHPRSLDRLPVRQAGNDLSNDFRLRSGQQADFRQVAQVAEQERQSGVGQQGAIHFRRPQMRGRRLHRQPILRDETRHFRASRRPLRLLERPDCVQNRVGVRQIAHAFPALSHPVVERVASRVLRFWVRQTQQIPMRPAISLLIFDRPERQRVRRLPAVPVRDRVPQAASPAPQSVHILREMEQVRADSSDFRQRGKRRRARFIVPDACRQRQREQGRIVLRGASRLRDFRNLPNHALPVFRDALRDRRRVLPRQFRLCRIVRPALRAQNQEPGEARPAIHGERAAARRVRDLRRSRNRFALRGSLSSQFCQIVCHNSLSPFPDSRYSAI